MPTVRYGAVSYLNARPLVEGLRPLELALPADLVARHAAGAVDVALLPVAAAGDLPRVGALGVAADGPVDSVLLFLRRPVAEVATLALDPASRTSRVLAQLLLRERYGVSPVLVDGAADAELVIGDAALVRGAGGEGRLDLAAAWRDWTGLPFVFAAWYGRAPEVAPALEAAYERGAARIPAYAAEAAGVLPAPELERYLRERIRYRIGAREEEGLARFLRLSRDAGLL